jgi:hypothetical protein
LIVDSKNAKAGTNSADKESLAGWVMKRVDSWEQWRNINFDTRWDEYYRIWRGFWTDGDKNRAGERSRIICPELAQSIETCVAELEDATFIRDRWIDVAEDVGDEKSQEQMDKYVRFLLEDYSEYGVTQAVSEIYLNGALYGTGIGKIAVERVEEPSITQNGGLPSIEYGKKYKVKLIPIAPRNFVIDPVARSIQEALGCAHVIRVPLSLVQKRIDDGTYRSINLYSYEEEVDKLGNLAEYTSGDNGEYCKLVEWHGLVPKRLLDKKEELFDDLEDAIKSMPSLDTTIGAVGSISADGNEEMVEAIVTIINNTEVARAVENPFLFGDRSIIAYQHDSVPNRFWGRGVAEKGYNPQKALDAEIRARIDALALSTHPMMAIDASKIPRGERFDVRPGRNILTTGNPQEALFPLKFMPPDPHTFQQTQELREMIQRATGGYELPAMMNDANRMAATSMSMVVGSMIKRSRRTLANIEREFLNPLVKKSLYRYMQFDSERFPMMDYKFRVRSSMGIMAREFEQGQMISLLSTVPHESPAYWMLIKGIYENSSIDSREDMVKQCDQFLQQAMHPQPPPPDPKVQIEQAKLEFEKKKHDDLMNIKAVETFLERKKTQADFERQEAQEEFNKAMAVFEMIKAEGEKQKQNADTFNKVMTAYAAVVNAKANELKALMSGMQPVQTGESTTSTTPEGKTTKTEKSFSPAMEMEEAEELLDEQEVRPLLEKLLKLLEKEVSVDTTKSVEKKVEKAIEPMSEEKE